MPKLSMHYYLKYIYGHCGRMGTQEHLKSYWVLKNRRKFVCWYTLLQVSNEHWTCVTSTLSSHEEKLVETTTTRVSKNSQFTHAMLAAVCHSSYS